MDSKRVIKIGLLVIGLAAADASSAQAQTAAEQFQASYDSEATGRLLDSLAALDRVPAARKDTFVVALRRGWLLYRLGRYAEAVDAYNAAITANPKAVEARVGILLPQLALRKWVDVEANARGALRLDPGNYLANLRLAFACYNLHRYDEAAGFYRKLHELYPSDVEVISGLGWALVKAGKVAEAAPIFREGAELAPKHAAIRDGVKVSGG